MNRNDEIVIVRRGGEEDEKKKGGVWKIAHADFMTAMMAFFLIMWLVNATDEEIKKSIANYFNPINLVSSPTDIRGLADPDPDSEPPASGENQGQRTGERPLATDVPGNAGSALGGGNVEEGNENTMASAGILTETDNAAFNDPFAELSSAAADIDPETPVAVDVPQSTLGAEGQTRRSEDTRDPFDPTYWQTARTRQSQTLRPGREPTSDVPPPYATVDASDAEPRGEISQPTPAEVEAVDGARTPPPATGSAEASVASFGPRSTVAEEVLAGLGPAQEDNDAEDASLAGESTTQEARAQAAQSALDALADALAGTSADVSLEGGGESSVLVSLTDDGAFSMFAIGSSSPTPEAEALFNRVGSVLADRSGQVVVRGHTDARPFRSGRSDNWVLSFERAYATKLALRSGGVAEDRFVRVEGLADREPANPADPLSDENRRIEILYVPSVGDTAASDEVTP